MDKNSHYNKIGLTNLGNTCFLNACVQILNHTYALVSVMKSPKIQKILEARNDCPDTKILKGWLELVDLANTNSDTNSDTNSSRRTLDPNTTYEICPRKFVIDVHQIATMKGRDLFTGWGQNDMNEFLLFMIECMHNSISRSIDVVIRGSPAHKMDEDAVRCYEMLKSVYSKEYSEIMDLFYGIYISEIGSGATIHSSKPEHFFMLDLDIPNRDNPTLYDCFDAFVVSEKMCGENAWWNEKTGKKEEADKKITFWSFPKILVIVLKRFSPDGRRKIHTRVDFPIHLDLRKYVNGYLPEQYTYSLYGVCNHMGGVMGGHYTAFVKNAENEWFHYNDNVVSVIRESDVVSPMAYCLFYAGK